MNLHSMNKLMYNNANCKCKEKIDMNSQLTEEKYAQLNSCLQNAN